MQKPQDFDNVQEFGSFTPLPAGGYVCRIMGVEETQSKSNKPMIKVSVDIYEGEFKDYYATMYRNDTRTDKKWNAGAIVNQLVYDTTGNNSTNRGFKTFITAVCNSNPGFNVAWGDGFAACFKNRLVGVLFGREEYIGTDGKTHWSTKALSFRSADSIRKGDFKTPDDKPLVDTQYSYSAAPSNYTTPAANVAQTNAQPPQNAGVNLNDFEEIISTDDLPF